jgi:hypothetical protein
MQRDIILNWVDTHNSIRGCYFKSDFQQFFDH